MLRATGIVAATAALVAGGIALAAPGNAAALFERDALVVIGGDVLYLSTSTGALTPAGELPVDRVMGADWDPTTGLVFYVNDGDPDDDTPCALYSYTFVAGTSTLIGDMDYDDCASLDVGPDGTLRVGTGTGLIATVDKTDASTLSHITVGIEPLWIAQDFGPSYVGDSSGAIYSLDVSTGGTTLIGEPDGAGESADFDSSGMLWLSVFGDECSQGLAALNISDPDATYAFRGDFLAGDECVDGYALFIVPGRGPAAEEPGPEAVLPATGTGATGVLVAAGGLAILAGAGALLVARGRRAA